MGSRWPTVDILALLADPHATAGPLKFLTRNATTTPAVEFDCGRRQPAEAVWLTWCVPTLGFSELSFVFV